VLEIVQTLVILTFMKGKTGIPSCVAVLGRHHVIPMAVAVVSDRLRMDKIRGRVTDSEPDGRALPAILSAS
jgi:hypothetical protein